jgi:NitT/TauT family transport system substrate-binding protein
MKKLISFLVVLTMTVSMLAGCGKKEETPSGVATNATTAPTQSAPTETAPTKAAEDDTTAKESITLNVAYMPNYGSLWSIENAIAQAI